jgi:hypothetical protein
MSIYASPRIHNGALNTIFNNSDYIQLNAGGKTGLTISQTDAKYLQISGVTSSSAQTVFQNTVDIKALLTVDNITVKNLLDASNINVTTLATIDNLNVTKLLKSTQSSDTLTAEVFRADQVYSFTNGMVYSIISTDTIVNSVSFINIPTTTNQSYIFTFILQPSAVNSPYYIKSSSNTVNVNGVSIPLYGLQNVSLPANYTYLVQQISIIYNLYGTNPQFVALTSVSAY